MQTLTLTLLFVGVYSSVLLPTTAAPRRTLFYRKDYTYVPEFNAYYKLHWDRDGTNWKSAFLSCQNEGSTLFYPTEVDEWKVVKTLIGDMAEHPNTTDVFIGVHSKFHFGEFITVDGHFLPSTMDFQHVEEDNVCALMDIGSDPATYKQGPCSTPSPTIFVCKRVDDKRCPTIDKGYLYSDSSKKCYKVNENAKNWEDAMHTCYMEGGILAGDKINGVQLKSNEQMYYIGIRDLFHDGSYYSVKGNKIEDAKIIVNTPDRRYNNYGEVEEEIMDGYRLEYLCGALRSSTILAVSCYDKRPFICEMEPTQEEKTRKADPPLAAKKREREYSSNFRVEE